MVVENKKINKIIPIIIGLMFSIMFLYLPDKKFIVGALGLIGVSFVFYDLFIGIVVGVFVLPFLPDILGLLYMYFLLGVFLFNQIFRNKTELTHNKMDIPVVLYLVIILYSTITSINPMGSLRDLALHIGGLSFLFVMVNSIDNKEKLNRIVTFLVFTATLISLIGFYQYIVGVELDAAWVDVENNPNIRTRIYSVFYNPNILAEYLVMIIPISVALFWYTKNLSKKIIFLITSLIMSLALVLTLSRGGWLGFAFSAFVFILLIEKRLLLSIFPVVIGGIYLLPQTIINRILSIGNLSDSSNAYRFKIWEITKQVIKDNWTAGVGFGHLPFKQTFESYIRTMPTYHAHNTYLQVAAEIGIPGLIAFLFLLFVTFKYGIMYIKKTEDRYLKILGAGVISGLAGVLLHGAVENVLYIPRIIITFWMMISFIFTIVRLEDRKLS